MVFNSRVLIVDSVRYLLIQGKMPDILSFGHYFHEWFIKSIIEK